MTAAEARAYLEGRVRAQRHEKTTYNRLRWTLRDLAAVDALLAAPAAASGEGRSWTNDGLTLLFRLDGDGGAEFQRRPHENLPWHGPELATEYRRT